MEAKPPTKPKGEKKKKSKKAPTDQPTPVTAEQVVPRVEIPRIAQPLPVAEKKVPVDSNEKQAKKKKSSKSRKGPEVQEAPPVAAVPEPVKSKVTKPPPSNAIMQATPAMSRQASDDGNPAETVDDDDGYGDDDFDDYSDDAFEPYETIKKPAAKVVSDTISGVKRVSQDGTAGGDVALGRGALKEIQQAMKEENDAAMNRRRERLQANDRGLEDGAKEVQAEAKEAEQQPAREKKQSKSSRAPSKPVARKYLQNLGADLSSKSKLQANDPRVLRANMLKKQIKFNQEKSILIDQPPVSEYDLYMRKLHNRLNSSIAQKSCQSNEDDRTIETQTDEIEVMNQEVQFQCGDDDTGFYNLISNIKENQNLNRNHDRNRRNEEGKEEEGKEVSDQTKNNSVTMGSSRSAEHTAGSLTRFLRKTTTVMENLLVELRGQHKGMAQIDLPSLKGMSTMFQVDEPWTSCEHHIQGANRFESCTFHGSSLLSVSNISVKSPLHPLAGTSVIGVWDAATKPHKLAHLLISECHITSICFSPNANHLIIGGSVEGNVMVWDLREDPTPHAIQLAKSLKWALTPKYPVLCTHHSADSNRLTHTSKIVSVESLTPTHHHSAAHHRSGEMGTSFNFSTVDDRGLLCFWLLSEADQSEASTATSSALTLDTRLRLVCSRTMVLKSACNNQKGAAHTGMTSGGKSDGGKFSLDEWLVKQYPGPSLLGVSFYPWSPNHFLSQHSDGRLIHECRFGDITPPHYFHQTDPSDTFSMDYLQGGTSANMSRVTSIAFSKFVDGVFLVGYEDGKVRLFHHTSADPRTCWDSHCFSDRDPTNSKSQSRKNPFDLCDHRSVVKVEWSPHRPSVFFVLDSKACLHVFDLLKEESFPILSERVGDGALASVGTLDESKESSEDHQISSSSFTFNPHGYSFGLSHFASRASLLAVSSDGNVKFRPLISSLTVPVEDEETLLNELLESLL